MSKKYKHIQVHVLHYLKVDEDGNDDGKIYEYDGDHSSFCDGIDLDRLIEVKDPFTNLMESGEKRR